MRRNRDNFERSSFVAIAIAACALTTVLVSGCASHNTEADDSVSLAEDGTDANDVESQSSALTASFTLACSDFSNPSASVKAASGVGSFFTPSSCITAEQDPPNNTVTYTLGANGIPCGGPWGLGGVTGTVKVVYATKDNAITLAVSATGLQFNSRRPNHATADLQGTASLSSQLAGGREMIWNASLTGTTARGNAFSRTSSWDTTWRVGESCISLDGSAEGKVNGRALKTSVTGYQRCLGSCPASGGEIKIQREDDGEEVTLEYDGGNDATFTGVNGKQTNIPLACGL
ncbi:MAG: hypothetical protein ABI461_06210 [Polyangiaceae bacterium]